MELVDTHCHIHEADAEAGGDEGVQAVWQRAEKLEPDVMIKAAAQEGVGRLICVGTTLADSQLAVKFVQSRPGCWASIGIHPHEAKDHAQVTEKLQEFGKLLEKEKVVAIGECGLDYFYEHSPRADQKRMFEFQLDLAVKHKLPLIFHVREAFDDFWPIFDNFKGLRGVVHSFTASKTGSRPSPLQRSIHWSKRYYDFH